MGQTDNSVGCRECEDIWDKVITVWVVWRYMGQSDNSVGCRECGDIWDRLITVWGAGSVAIYGTK